jgi:hypothetical protein
VNRYKTNRKNKEIPTRKRKREKESKKSCPRAFSPSEKCTAGRDAQPKYSMPCPHSHQTSELLQCGKCSHCDEPPRKKHDLMLAQRQAPLEGGKGWKKEKEKETRVQ